MFRTAFRLRFFSTQPHAANDSPQSVHLAKRIADVCLDDLGKIVRVRGWITAKRSMKSTIFLDVNDGSGAQNLQVLSAKDSTHSPLGYGASVDAFGVVGQTPSGQLELKAESLQVLGN